MYFYPRPPRGGRQRATTSPRSNQSISIHALREEGDTAFRDSSTITNTFLSTPSARRATGAAGPSRRPLRISIHALREEGDCVLGYITIFTERISIHALREEGDQHSGTR